MAPRNKVPDWLLERLAAGELDAEQAAAVKAQLAGEPEGVDRMSALKASNDEILERLPPERMLAQIQRRAVRPVRAEARSSAPLVPRFLFAAAALTAAGLAVVMIRPPASTHAGTSSTELEASRIKGGTVAIRVYRKHGEKAELLESGAQASPKDLLQLAYVAAGHPYGVLLSLDGRGTVTLHSPREGEAEAKLVPQGEVHLPFAYELDDAPTFERFFLVYGDAPLAVNTVMESAQRLAKDPSAGQTQPLDIPADWGQVSFLLRKASP